MKEIIRLSDGNYVHLDTYGERNGLSLLPRVIMSTFVIAIASMAACAMVGIDVTNIQSTPTQHQIK
jgi:hypothetical protein